MVRIIGIDYGLKRSGIAVTDPLQMIAGALETSATDELENRLEQYISAEPVERIVVGCPAKLDGSESDLMKHHIVGFVGRIKKKFPNIIVDTIDERYTSKLAVRAMIDGGMKKKYRQKKENIDKISATIILQDYLNKL